MPCSVVGSRNLSRLWHWDPVPDMSLPLCTWILAWVSSCSGNNAPRPPSQVRKPATSSKLANSFSTSHAWLPMLHAGQRVQQRHQRVRLHLDGSCGFPTSSCQRYVDGSAQKSRTNGDATLHRTQRNCVVQPARVDSACWNAAVAASTTSPNSWALVRAVNLRITSPATIPRTPPSFLRNAVIQPNFNVHTQHQEQRVQVTWAVQQWAKMVACHP